MVVFFSINHSEKTKRNIFQILQQLPFSLDPFSTKNINIEILGDIHRSHFIAKFPNMYWLRIHVYKKKDGKWMKIINSAHIYLRYHIGKRQYINPSFPSTRFLLARHFKISPRQLGIFRSYFTPLTLKNKNKNKKQK